MSQPPAKRRRVELTLEDKIKLITESTAQPLDGDFLATADTLLNIAENKIVKEKCAFKQRVILDFFVKS